MEWGSIASWVSGIGSLIASCVALFIAERGRSIRLDGIVGKRALIGGGLPQASVLTISVTNVGTRTAKITNVGMKYGRGRSRRVAIISVGVIDPEHPWLASSKLPISLGDGESAYWHIHLDDRESWIADLVSDQFISSWIDVETLRFVISTSQGPAKLIRPEKAIRDQLHDLVRQRALARLEANG